MTRKSLSLLLLFVVFLEGYIVLSTELLVIRLVAPHAGNSTDVLSIIIAAVLMPLAFGYHFGGRFRPTPNEDGKITTRRSRLILNLTLACLFLAPSLSWVFVKEFYHTAAYMTGIDNRLVLTALYCLFFTVPPVFLLGQTVPLVSNFFPRQRHGSLAGKILFFSTLGSFVGATGSTLLLMATVGVHNTAIVSIASIALLTFLLSRQKLSPQTGIVAACLALSLYLNSPMMMRDNNIVTNNQYHTIQITDFSKTEKALISDGNTSSIYDTQSGTGTAPYITYVDRTFIDHMMVAPKVKDILIIGAAGFTVGLADKQNNYTFLDIDSTLKQTAEEKFLGQKLSPNKKFIPVEVRRFLNQTQQKYDLIMFDAYVAHYMMPETLVTREFFQQLNDSLKDGGILVANFAVQPAFSDAFSVRLDRTFRSVFPVITRQVLGEYDGWQMKDQFRNVVYIYYKESEKSQGIYTDDKNPSAFDRGQ